jgi:hypothetical protein
MPHTISLVVRFVRCHRLAETPCTRRALDLATTTTTRSCAELVVRRGSRVVQDPRTGLPRAGSRAAWFARPGPVGVVGGGGAEAAKVHRAERLQWRHAGNGLPSRIVAEISWQSLV